MTVFVDGDLRGCNCGPNCEMPCWQRVGLTDRPCCKDCAPLLALEQDEEAQANAA